MDEKHACSFFSKINSHINSHRCHFYRVQMKEHKKFSSVKNHPGLKIHIPEHMTVKPNMTYDDG
jgi:hypothetical protein